MTVSPTYRRQGIANKLMDILEDVTINRYVWEVSAMKLALQMKKRGRRLIFGPIL